MIGRLLVPNPRVAESEGVRGLTFSFPTSSQVLLMLLIKDQILRTSVLEQYCSVESDFVPFSQGTSVSEQRYLGKVLLVSSG